MSDNPSASCTARAKGRRLSVTPLQAGNGRHRVCARSDRDRERRQTRQAGRRGQCDITRSHADIPPARTPAPSPPPSLSCAPFLKSRPDAGLARTRRELRHLWRHAHIDRGLCVAARTAGVGGVWWRWYAWGFHMSSQQERGQGCPAAKQEGTLHAH